MKGDRIVIPKDLQEETLEKLHTGHQGIVKTIDITEYRKGIGNGRC